MPMVERQHPPPEDEKPKKAPSTTSAAITEAIGWILFAIMLGGLGAVFGLPMLTDQAPLGVEPLAALADAPAHAVDEVAVCRVQLLRPNDVQGDLAVG